MRGCVSLCLRDGASVAAAGDRVPDALVIGAAKNVVAVERGAVKWNSDSGYRFPQPLRGNAK